MQYPALGNPIWSGQLVLLGGWRKVFWSAGLYALIAGVVCALFISVDDFGPPAAAANRILSFLALIQLAVLYGSGSSIRTKALVRDHQTQMMESIRTSPTPAGLIVLGYVIGPAIATIATWLAGMLVGLWLIIGYDLGSIQSWVVGNILMLFSAISAWTMQVFLSVGLKKPTNRLMIAYVACYILVQAESAILLLPGLPIFLGFQSGWMSLRMMRVNLATDSYFSVALAANFGMIVFWWWAAARRLRRPDLPALTTRGALLLCLLWYTCSVVGIHLVRNLFAGSQFLKQDIKDPMILALCGSMLIFVAFPISSAIQRLRIGIFESQNPLKHPRSNCVLVAILSLVIQLVALGLAIYDRSFNNEQLVMTVLILVATAMAFHGLLQASCFRKGQTATGWTQMVAYWVLPIILASVWHGIQITRGVINDSEPMNALFSFSPVGALISLWAGVDAEVKIGIGVQFGVAVLALIYGYGAEKSFRRQRHAVLAERTHRDPTAYSVPSNSGDET